MSTDVHLPPEIWTRHIEPGNGRVQWRRNGTEEHFYTDDPGPWTRYRYEDSYQEEKHWWCLAGTGRWFHEDSRDCREGGAAEQCGEAVTDGEHPLWTCMDCNTEPAPPWPCEKCGRKLCIRCMRVCKNYKTGCTSGYCEECIGGRKCEAFLRGVHGRWKDNGGSVYDVSVRAAGREADVITTRPDGRRRATRALIWVRQYGEHAGTVMWGSSHYLERIDPPGSRVEWIPVSRGTRYYWGKVTY